jgi:hypothetical protein
MIEYYERPLPFGQLFLSGTPHFPPAQHGPRQSLSKRNTVVVCEGQIATLLWCGGDLGQL